jgi:phage terminase large subunit-like protein
MPHRNSFMYPLPADEASIVGMDPTFVLIDEVGYVESSTFTTMTSSLGKMDDTLALAVGTPGLGIIEKDGGPNIMWRMRELYRSEAPPPGLAYVEFASDLDADIEDRRQWRKANPGLGDLVDWKAVEFDFATLPPSVFRQMRLGLWTTRERQWMAPEDWDALPIVPGQPIDGATIVLAFDGSVSGDATALQGWEMATNRLFTVGYWQKPPGSNWEWKVPRSEVVATVEMAFTRWNVVHMYMDPPYWREEMEKWQEELGPERIIEFPTFARNRMAVATDRFYTMVKKGELSWDGDPDLRAHIMSCVAERTPAGEVVRKDARHPLLIDKAVTSIIAAEAAAAADAMPVPAIY